MTRTTLLVLALCAGCSKKSDEAPAAKSKEAPAEVAKSNAGSPATASAGDALAGVLPKDAPNAFAAWDLPGRAKAWQGSFIREDEAIEVKGATVTTWDGTKEKKLAFSLESPCSARFSETHDGMTESTTHHFTVKDGKLISAMGDAGSRKGKSAIACVSNEILTLDESGKCESWSNHFDRWKSEVGTCGFEQRDGKEAFVAKVNGMETVLAVDGDALLGDRMVQTPVRSFPDFAAAKAA